MSAILIIIGLILLFRFVLTSKAATNLPQKTSIVNTGSCGSAGDNFTSGSGIVAGVSEPTHCNLIRVGTKMSDIPMPGPLPVFHPPLHVTYPIAPPPIKIQQPILPGPMPRPYVGAMSCRQRAIYDAGELKMLNCSRRGSPAAYCIYQ